MGLHVTSNEITNTIILNTHASRFVTLYQKFTEPSNANKGYARCNTLEGHQILGLCDHEFLENPTPELEMFVHQ